MRYLPCLFLVICCGLVARAQVPAIEPAWLAASGENSAQIIRAWDAAPEEARGDLRFLLAHMRAEDLRSLSAEFLLENLRLARAARAEAPWKAAITDEIYRNAILPFAQIDEPRDPWRRDFRERFLPLVAEARSPGEAALILNRKIFGLLKVRYSTERKRANQSPKESIEQGMASCTGLSIILADACRAVGIPARLAGVANWSKRSGNHTWVEVWSEGAWHYLGAAEPADRLDDAWFAADAAVAEAGSQDRGVFAVHHEPTGAHFPLVWALEDESFPAVEVTARYRGDQEEKRNGVRLLVRVLDGGKRVAEPVRLDRVGAIESLEGTSRGEVADLNDLLEFDLPREGVWRVRAGADERQRIATFRPAASEVVTLTLGLPEASKDLPGKLNSRALEWFDRAFQAIAENKDLPEAPDSLTRLLTTEAGDRALRLLAFESFRRSPLVADLQRDFAARTVRNGEHVSPYTLKTVGTRPEGGWPLVIALHGGGGAPKEVNDQQWGHMQIYYKDHPEASGYLYLALRAPNDTWNGFYDDYVYPLIENLVRSFLLFGDVNPDRVLIIGYSHGGYGVFAIAPKIPYRFAAAHASASAPTDGETSARGLRNLPFSFMVGEKDTAYGRAERCPKFAAELQTLSEADPGGWPAAFLFKPGFGHGGLPDRDFLPALLGHRRDPCPLRLDWELTDGTVKRHYWLSTTRPGKNKKVKASLIDQRLQVEASGLENLTALLDARILDFARPLTLVTPELTSTVELRPSLAVLARSLALGGDPQLAWTVELPLLRP